MTNKLNDNQISALQSLNQQIADNNTPNTEPVEICEPMSNSDKAVDTNALTTPNESPIKLKLVERDEYTQCNEIPISKPVCDFEWLRVYKSGLFALVASKDEKDNGKFKHIGNYIMPVGKTVFNGISCLLLEFINNSGKQSNIMIERGDLADHRGLAKKLLNAGYNLDIYYSKQLQGFLNQFQPDSEVIATTQIGWVNDSYVLPDLIIGDNKNIRYYGSVVDGKFTRNGTLEQWRDNVASHCGGYEMLELGLYSGFASLLMPFVDFGFGLHFHGNSSKGKTTILRAASSIFGKPKEYINKWNATHNGMEFIGYNSNHALCALDEVNEAGRSTLDSIYMLIDGRGKSRAISSKINGVEQAKSKTWQTVVLSTGEVSIEDLALQYGKNLKAGESVRMIDIEVNQICKDKAHADTLIENSAKYYGVACIAFVEYLQAHNSIDIVSMYKQYYREIIAPFNELHSQASRVAKYFALLRVAGDIAVQAEILPNTFKPQYYTNNLFNSWLQANSMDKETKEIINALILAVDDYTNWFSDSNLDYEVRIPNKIGIHDGYNYFLISTLTANKLYKVKHFAKHRDVLIRAEIIPKDRQSLRDKATKNPLKGYKINQDNLNKFRSNDE
ncbi:MAG: DUF927 domain-containing protein [Neisseriales bacterium]|nr:MAG: DUF927 domain-containing protein [Neisseriales bacterium]